MEYLKEHRTAYDVADTARISITYLLGQRLEEKKLEALLAEWLWLHTPAWRRKDLGISRPASLSKYARRVTATVAGY